MRLSFNQRSHAFVAFSPPNFRVKAPRESAPDDAKFAPPEEMLEEIWEAPQ
jgi:hypothetical protein